MTKTTIANEKKGSFIIDLDKAKRISIDDNITIATVQTSKKIFGKGLAKVGEYKVQCGIGNGASGKVKHVTRDGKHFAMKKVPLPTEERERNEKLHKLQNEVECLYKCQGHPNVLTLEEALISKHYFFMVTELARDGDIFDFISTYGPLSDENTVKVMRDVFSALAHMHERGIAHRDIKPENLLITKDLHSKLCDFGFAVEWNPEEGLLSKCLGTVRCLPPEMIKTTTSPDPKYNPFCGDMWSAGILLFFLLTGRFPFDGSSHTETLKNIKKRHYTRCLPPNVNTKAKDLLEQILVSKPQNRLTAAQALEHPFFQ